MSLTNRDIIIRAPHARYARELMEGKFFEGNWQLCVAAPLAGLLARQRQAPPAAGPEPAGDARPPAEDPDDFRVPARHLAAHKDEILFNLRLILLCDRAYEPADDLRIRRAFDYADPDDAAATPPQLREQQQDEQLYMDCMLLGLEVLHRELIGAGRDRGENIAHYIKALMHQEPDRSLAEEIGLVLPGSSEHG